MDSLKELINILLLLLPLAGAARGIYCAIVMAIREDERDVYKRRLENLMYFIAIAESCTAIIALVLSYLV